MYEGVRRCKKGAVHENKKTATLPYRKVDFVYTGSVQQGDWRARCKKELYTNTENCSPP